MSTDKLKLIFVDVNLTALCPWRIHSFSALQAKYLAPLDIMFVILFQVEQFSMA